MHKLLILLLTLVAFSCTKEKTVSITTNISDPELQELIIGNEVLMISDTIKNLNGGNIELKLNDFPSILKVQAGRIADYLYVEAGSAITITKDIGSRALNISNSNDAEQKLISEFDKQMDIASSKYNLNEIADTSEAAFEILLGKKYETVINLITQNKSENVSPELLAWLEGRIEANALEARVFYPDYYKYLKKRDPILSDGFYSAENDFDINDQELYYFDDVKLAALSILGRGIHYEDYENLSDYYADRYKKVDEKIKNEAIAEVLKFKILNDKINYAGGIQGFESEIDDFLSNVKDATKKQIVESAVSKWAHLKVGLDAPDFMAYTRNGEEVKLSDLKGKNVYIDVWATWCGPCIAEIPSLKKMEEKYHDENIEFVSVSIDKESDRDKWIRFVEEKDLKGIQVMSKNDWNSQLTTQYNIAGIPRFIMIDANGSIVSADAPRPSNEKSFTKMIEAMLN